uniref:Uncharacterized protein n=1 Tax=Oryza punctata TaxID=4537 RepID=A0A0E0KHN8_ORYPU
MVGACEHRASAGHTDNVVAQPRLAADVGVHGAVSQAAHAVAGGARRPLHVLLSITVHEYGGTVGCSRDNDSVHHLTAEEDIYSGGGGGDNRVVLSMADDKEVAIHFRGAMLWWSSNSMSDDD